MSSYEDILEIKSEMNENIVDSEEFIIKEETNKELVLNDELRSVLRDIKTETFESDDSHPDFMNDKNNYDTNILEFKSETDVDVVDSKVFVTEKIFVEEIILKDKLESLQHEIKEENKNENIIGENVQISDNSALFPTEKETISKQDEKEHTGGKSYNCEICNKSFRQSQNFKRHRLTHTGEKPFSCEVCNKLFRHLPNLQRHKLVHIDEKQYTCAVCNKSFRQLLTFKRHELVHTNKKPFTCEVCNKSFRQMLTLKQHKLVHTGEKPFTCEVCDKSFRHLNTLKEHKLVHTGGKPFTCEICNKSFRHSNTLKEHKFVHTGEKPFVKIRASYPNIKLLEIEFSDRGNKKIFIFSSCQSRIKKISNDQYLNVMSAY